MCIFNTPSAPAAPKPIIQEDTTPTAPELGGKDEEQRKRKAQSVGIRQLRTDVGGLSRGKLPGIQIRK